MTPIISYIRDFSRTVHSGLLLFALAFTAVAIWLNYRFGLETGILHATASPWGRFIRFYALYFVTFCLPTAVAVAVRMPGGPPKGLIVLALAAPAIFAAKVSFHAFGPSIQELCPGAWGRYWALIIRLPAKLLLVLGMLYVIWKAGRYESGFFGSLTPGLQLKPYLVLLAAMVPLIGWASLQPAFLHTYPKVQVIRFIEPYTANAWGWKLLYELSYGLDFVTIELFFRGFLVLAFIKYLKQDAIIPMAVFYCSIHFGKPVAECISSFFGGLLLGIIVYHTRSIAGGLIVHLGIAWMMEAGGAVGRMLTRA